MTRVPWRRVAQLLTHWVMIARLRVRLLTNVFLHPNEDAAVLLDLTNEVAPLHDTCSSATRRTSRMLPLVSS
jgi:hypothetical protein